MAKTARKKTGASKTKKPAARKTPAKAAKVRAAIAIHKKSGKPKANRSTAKKSPSKSRAKSSSKPRSNAAANTHASYKNPKGGLSAAGREHFRKTEGAHLKAGVHGKADTPEKMKRKGSFLRRHFANPAGPMVKDGKPTRLALSAHAWGEPVPKTPAAAKKLAAKGAALLKRYASSKEKRK